MSSQLNSAHSTWFMKRAARLAWTHAHIWTLVHCVRTTKWTAASALLVSAVYMHVLFFDIKRSFNDSYICVERRDCVRRYFHERVHRSVWMSVQTQQNLQLWWGLPTGQRGMVRGNIHVVTMFPLVPLIVPLYFVNLNWVVAVHVLKVDGLVRASKHLLHVQLKRARM